MFTEFFCGSPKTVAIAWGGAGVVVGYSWFVAHVKAKLNGFYETFYDLLGEGGGAGGGDLGSGDAFGSGEAAGSGLADQRARVYHQLWLFALIIAPLVSASPACKYVRSAWAFHWRLALMKAYLVAWDTKQEPIEGAAQRLHEDTQRFSDGLDGCLVAVLDAGFTLVLFTPILVGLSEQILPPLEFGALDGSWLWVMAFASSLIGLAGAAFFGQKLVGLEVANQRVEALLRKDLVLLETTPAVIVGTEATEATEATSAAANAAANAAAAARARAYDPSSSTDAPPSPPPPPPARVQAFLPQTYFLQTLRSLKLNYFALFKHFGVLNFWLSLFDQCMVILPYVLVAPLIFAQDPGHRITLGLLIKVSNSFGHVFGSLSVVSENWGAINDFRSVLRRLREFEDALYAEAAGTNRLLTETAFQMSEVRAPAEARAVATTTTSTSTTTTNRRSNTDGGGGNNNDDDDDGGDDGPPPPPLGRASLPAHLPVVDGVDPVAEAASFRRRGRIGPRAARGEGLPIEIHVDHPPDAGEDMRV